MRVFVTGASGWIGSAIVTELLDAGHHVLGLARSDAAADDVAALGAEVRARRPRRPRQPARRRGRRPTASSTSATTTTSRRWTPRPQTDRAAIEAIGARARGHRPPAAHRLRHARPRARPGRHRERPARTPASHPRIANAQRALAFADRGVRSVVVRFAPTVHGAGRPRLRGRAWSRIAREKGVSAYIGDGANRWPAVHRLDAAAWSGWRSRTPPAGVGAARRRRGGRRRPATSPRRIGRGLDVPVASVAGEARRRALRLARHVLRRRRAGLERADPRAAGLAADAARA